MISPARSTFPDPRKTKKLTSLADAVDGVAGNDHAQLEDGVPYALIPALGVADAQDHLRVGIALHEFLIERAGWPINGCLIFSDYPIPVCRFSSPGGDPESRVLRMLEDLGHVVARAEAQSLERDLQRHRAGPAEAGPYDFHASSWRTCSLRIARAASTSGTCPLRSSEWPPRTRRRLEARTWRSPPPGGSAVRPPSRSRLP